MTVNELTDKDLFLFDLDGTLYLGEQVFPFTVPLLNLIKLAGKRYMFMTNNSSKSALDYVKKMAKMGIPVSKQDFITSAFATAHYLLKNYKNETFYVLGTESLKNEFRSFGLNLTDNLSEVTALVIGFDTELTFKKLEDACKLLLNNPDLPFIATHPDSVCPTEYGYVPDCGSMCDMLFNATGRRPMIIGKPKPLMPLLAMEHAGSTPEKTVVIGDRMHTDVLCGIRAGATGVLVLSGESTLKTVEEYQHKPDIILKSAEELLKAFKAKADYGIITI